MEIDLLDKDGYPTMETLNKIRRWPLNDFKGMMEFIKPIWKYSDEGYWSEIDYECEEFKGTRYNLSTGGWSGNEDLVQAMGENGMFWILCWYQSQRGGHFIFEVREPEDNQKQIEVLAKASD